MSVDKGGGGGASTSTNNTTVNVSTNVVGPPINIAVGSEFLKPISDAFAPISSGVAKGLQTLSDQSQNLSNQAQSVVDFTKQSNAQLTGRQNDLEHSIQLLMKGLLIAGVVVLGLKFIPLQRRAA